MLNYELSLLVPYGAPVLGGIICLVIGMLIANKAWKTRIFRYAKAEIIQIMEYQKNKIEQLEDTIKENKIIISDQKGIIKQVNISALKIIGVTK